MWTKRISRRPADILYSKWLRKKIGKCEKCGYPAPDGVGTEVSHFYSRRNESVRFDVENTDVLCHKCALRWSGVFDYNRFEEQEINGKAEYKAWKLKKMGQIRFDMLTLAAHTHKRKDDKLVIMWIRQMMKEEEIKK